MQKVYFVTGNQKKVDEARAIIPGIDRLELDLVEMQSLDPKEVISAKLKEAHRQAPDKILAVEDVSYSVAGLDGLPGTLIKWFNNTVRPVGLYELVKDKNTATVAMASIGLVYPGGKMMFFEGEIKGRTVEAIPKDGEDFDCVFMPDGYDKRFSEMTSEQKNKISHRSIAWNKLKQRLEQ